MCGSPDLPDQPDYPKATDPEVEKAKLAWKDLARRRRGRSQTMIAGGGQGVTIQAQTYKPGIYA